MALTIKAEEVDLTNRSHIFEIITEIEGEQNRRRKKDAFVAYESKEGRQKDHVEDRLKMLYPETWQKFRVGDVRIVDKVIRKKAQAYMTSPLRRLDTERETEFLESIYDEYKFSRAFKEADSIYNLHKYVALWLHYNNPKENSDELRGSYSLQALAPYEYDLIKNERGYPEIFILSYAGTEVTKGADGIEQLIAEDQRDTSAETKRYRMWSKDFYAEVETRGKKDGRPYISKMDIKPNKIKRLPIAYLQKDTAEDYPIQSNLGDASISWNTEFSDLKTAAATQGHAQLIIKHPENMKLRQLHVGMHTAINLPQSRKDTDKPTEADYISPSPDLAGQLEVLKFSLLQILDDEGITSSNAITGGVNEVKSGFDRLLKEADVNNLITSNQELYADCLEADLYLCLKAYEDALNQATLQSDKIEIYFPKKQVLISDKETLENLRIRDELGLLLSYEKHQIINPNLSDEEARQREEAISEEKAGKVARMQALIGGDDSEEEGDEEEAPEEEGGE